MNLRKSGPTPRADPCETVIRAEILSRPPRCGAKAKSTGLPCRAPAMKNKQGRYTRCRFHGGDSTGPRTPEGLARSRRANWQHGLYSAEARAFRRADKEDYKLRIETLTRWIERCKAIAQMIANTRYTDGCLRARCRSCCTRRNPENTVRRWLYYALTSSGTRWMALTPVLSNGRGMGCAMPLRSIVRQATS